MYTNIHVKYMYSQTLRIRSSYPDPSPSGRKSLVTDLQHNAMHTYRMCVQLSGSLAYPDIFVENGCVRLCEPLTVLASGIHQFKGLKMGEMSLNLNCHQQDSNTRVCWCRVTSMVGKEVDSNIHCRVKRIMLTRGMGLGVLVAVAMSRVAILIGMGIKRSSQSQEQYTSYHGYWQRSQTKHLEQLCFGQGRDPSHGIPSYVCRKCAG